MRSCNGCNSNRCNLHGTWRGPSVGVPRDVGTGAIDEGGEMVEDGAADDGEGGNQDEAGEDMEEAA